VDQTLGKGNPNEDKPKNWAIPKLDKGAVRGEKLIEKHSNRKEKGGADQQPMARLRILVYPTQVGHDMVRDIRKKPTGG